MTRQMATFYFVTRQNESQMGNLSSSSSTTSSSSTSSSTTTHSFSPSSSLLLCSREHTFEATGRREHLDEFRQSESPSQFFKSGLMLSIKVSKLKFTWTGSTPFVSDKMLTHFQKSKAIKVSKMKFTWSDSTPVVSACSSMSRLQSMLVAVKQSPRSTMSTFNTCNILGHKFWPELGSFCWILTRAVSPIFRLTGPILTTGQSSPYGQS